MRDRRIQRLLRKTKEKGLSPKDQAGLPDPTPFEAVKRIIRKEKKETEKANKPNAGSGVLSEPSTDGAENGADHV